MSDERRNRQQEPGKNSNTNRILLYVGILVLFGLAFYAGRYRKNHKYDAFAQCLASKQTKMYGLFWCPHCADQKRMFGESFHYVPYVECAIRGSKEMATECKAVGVKLFPSWQFGLDAPQEGILSLHELSQKTGCSLP